MNVDIWCHYRLQWFNWVIIVSRNVITITSHEHHTVSNHPQMHSFTKEFNPRFAQRLLKISGCLAKKCTSKDRLRNGGHFIHGEMSWLTDVMVTNAAAELPAKFQIDKTILTQDHACSRHCDILHVPNDAVWNIETCPNWLSNGRCSLSRI